MKRIKLPEFKLRRMHKQVIVELSSYFLKIALFKGAKLEWWEFRGLEAESDREISDIIKEIFKVRKIKHATGILVLPRDLIKVGTLHLPSVDKEEIASMVRINALRQVPYPKEEIVLGWRITFSEGGFSDVLLAICQRNIIRRFLVILETAGLSIEDIRIVSEGSLSWLLERENTLTVTEGAGFILDIHKYCSDLIAFKGDNLLDSCLISQGADFLEKGQDNLRHFINEFKQATEMLPAGLLEKHPNSLFIIGAKPNLPGLEESLKQDFNLKVSKRQVTQQFPGDVSFAGVLGIGERPLSKTILFDVPDIKVKKLWRKKLRQLILLGSLLAYSIIMALVILGIKIYKSQDELAQLQLDYSRYAKQAEMLSALMQRIKIIQDIKSPQESLAYYLYTVSEVLPQGCRVVSFDFKKASQLVIRGRTQAVSLVFDFVSSLEKTGAFSEVKTNYTRKIKATGKDEGNEFEIVCFLK